MQVENNTQKSTQAINPVPTQEEEEKKRKLLMIKLDAFVKLRPFINRYTRLVKLEERFDMKTQWVRQHSNRLMIFGVTEEHPIVKDDLKIESIFYKILDNDVSKMSKLVSGKKKSKFLSICRCVFLRVL